jgi:hypothetical protein
VRVFLGRELREFERFGRGNVSVTRVTPAAANSAIEGA